MSSKKRNNKIKNNKRKKISMQKVFWSISIAFLFSCLVFYGARFIYFYNKFKVKEEASITLYQDVLNNNYDDKSIKSINGNYYFSGKDANNYVIYSNMLFRIVKLNEKKETVTLITENFVTDLSMGENKKFNDSFVNTWLNDSSENGVFVNNMNNSQKFLTKTSTCLDMVDSANNKKCEKEDNNNYVALLSLTDYINTGNVDSFLNNGQYFYLSSNTSNNETWYVNEDGKVGINDGTDLYGIRPVITIDKGIKVVSGNGTKNNPYIIDKDQSYFGGYVKLDNDMWRIYQVNDNEFKLMLDDYLMVADDKLKHDYSNNTYEYDDGSYGSLANYLNKTYYNSLSYKDIIVENKYSNGYYMKEDYKETRKETVKAKVGLISIGDVIINNTLDDYFTATGNVEDGKMVYVVRSNGRIVTKSIGSESYVVPCITIKKDNIKSGIGTKDKPFGLK